MKRAKIFDFMFMTTYVIIAFMAISLSPFKITADSPVKAKAQKTVEAVNDFAATTKEELEKEAREKIVELDKEIVALRDRAKHETGVFDAALQKRLKAIDSKRSALLKQIEAAKSSTTEAWGEIRKGVSTAWQDLRLSVSKASDQFSSHAEKKTTGSPKEKN